MALHDMTNIHKLLALRCVSLRCVTLRYVTFHYITLHYITLHIMCKYVNMYIHTYCIYKCNYIHMYVYIYTIIYIHTDMFFRVSSHTYVLYDGTCIHHHPPTCARRILHTDCKQTTKQNSKSQGIDFRRFLSLFATSMYMISHDYIFLKNH